MIKKITFITYFSVGLLLLAQVGLSIGRATDGDKLSHIQTELESLTRENRSLENQIYTLTSIENVSKSASAMSLLPAQITNLSSISVAMNRQ